MGVCWILHQEVLPMSHDRELLHIASAMAARLKVFKKTAMQFSELETEVSLHPRELWEAQDQAALEAFEAFMLKQTGAQPLFSADDLAEMPELA
jgi:hypothetical protein